jgi:ABC-type multidrug transport system permease subunit
MRSATPGPMRHPIVELTIVRTKEFLRETEAIFWVFGFPLILALALGFAFRSKPPDKIPVAVVEGPQAAARAAALAKSPVLLPHVVTASEGEAALRHGKISLLVSADAVPQYRFDATRPDARTARVETDAVLQSLAGRRDAFRASETHVTQQGSRYIDFLMPGILGMNLMGTGIWGVAFSIVNARMRKLLKRLIATPMKKWHFMVSQLLSRLIWLVLEATVLIAFGWVVFGVRVNGSLPLLFLICIVGGYAFSGLGLLISSRVRTIEAVSGMANLIMVPMWICSGVFFSYERFPHAIQPLIRALPLTALIDALRGVINDGIPFTQTIAPLAILIAWGAVSFALGLRMFRWQ